MTDSYHGDGPIINEAVLSWFPFSVNSPMSYDLHVKTTELEREDSLTMAIETMTEIEESGFITEVHRTSTLYENSTIAGFTYYYDRDVVKLERSIYNTFMLLGDVGGLFGLFVSIASSLLSILNF